MTRYAGCTCHALSLEPCSFCSDSVDPDVRALSLAESRVRRLIDRLENVRSGIMDSERHPCGYTGYGPNAFEDECLTGGACVAEEITRLEGLLVEARAALAKIENEVRT